MVHTVATRKPNIVSFADQGGIEPPTQRLTVACSTSELLVHYPFVSTYRFLSRHFPHGMFYLSVLPYWGLKSTL